jgi:hypothetical protein
MPRSPSARCIRDLGIAPCLDRLVWGSRRLRSGSCSPGREKSGGSGSCRRALPLRSRLHYALERTDDQWAASAWQRFVSHPPESAPAEACLKREGCLRCYEFWFGSAMTYCPQKAGNISNERGHRRTMVLRYATTLAARMARERFHTVAIVSRRISRPAAQSSVSSPTRKTHARKASLSSE